MARVGARVTEAACAHPLQVSHMSKLQALKKELAEETMRKREAEKKLQEATIAKESRFHRDGEFAAKEEWKNDVWGVRHSKQAQMRQMKMLREQLAEAAQREAEEKRMTAEEEARRLRQLSGAKEEQVKQDKILADQARKEPEEPS